MAGSGGRGPGFGRSSPLGVVVCRVYPLRRRFPGNARRAPTAWRPPARLPPYHVTSPDRQLDSTPTHLAPIDRWATTTGDSVQNTHLLGTYQVLPMHVHVQLAA